MFLLSRFSLSEFAGRDHASACCWASARRRRLSYCRINPWQSAWCSAGTTFLACIPIPENTLHG